MKETNEILRAIRNVKGLTQKQFADKLELKQSAYAMIESGKNKPSIDLLKSVAKNFKINPLLFFSEDTINDDNLISKNDFLNSKIELLDHQSIEADFLNIAHEKIKRINYLYQRLVNIRVLLFQELKIKGELSTQSETNLLNNLARPSSREINNETILRYPYEGLDSLSQAEYLQKLDACINLFTNTFFECFEQLYTGIRIPVNNKLSEEFLNERAKITGQWTYSHCKNSHL
jgi:transcriptional regulator with XRE-family HTH domain